MRRNTVSVGMAVLLLGLFVTALETPVVAQSFPKDAGNATDVINPYSPRFGHPYRRGVVPKRETHQNMKAWREQNIPVHRLVTTGKAPYGAINALQGKATKGSQTLAYNGGVDAIGVTSGTPKVYLVFWGTQWGTKGTDKDGNATFSGDARGAAPYMQKWLKGLGTNGELWSGVMTQYCDGPLVPYGATSCPAGAPHIGYPSGGALAGVCVLAMCVSSPRYRLVIALRMRP